MAKKQRAVVFAEGGKKNTFVINGPDAVEEARALVRSVGGTYHLEGFTAVEQAAVHLDGLKRAGNPVVRAQGKLTGQQMKRLGAKMHNWHASMGDPVYAAGSYYYTGKRHPSDETERDALANISMLLDRETDPQNREELLEIKIALERMLGEHGGRKGNPSGGPKAGHEEQFRAHMTDDDLEEIERNERATCECCAPGAHVAERARAAAHHREGNPHHLLEARNELTKAFGRPTGGNADWQNSAWFVQGSGGTVNPNRPDVHPGVYATKSIWVVEQPEESEYCVFLRDIDDEAGETMDTEVMCGPAAGIHGVIDAARAYAGEIFGRKGNPTSKGKSSKKMPQFGSSVTPALQGLVRDVTGKACYQETCFVSPGHDGHAPQRPRG